MIERRYGGGRRVGKTHRPRRTPQLDTAIRDNEATVRVTKRRLLFCGVALAVVLLFAVWDQSSFAPTWFLMACALSFMLRKTVVATINLRDNTAELKRLLA